MKNSIFGKGWTFIIFFLIMIFCFPLSAKANLISISELSQQQNVTGTVADASGPLPGVTINIKGTTINTVSADDGRFSIAAKIGDSLIFTYVGFTTLEIPVTNPVLGTIQLSEDPTTLEEVTINAGYYAVKQKESTGNISRVTSREIGNQPVSHPLAALQGRAPGVYITQDSGAPGGAFQIRIRGQNSLRGEANEPLYIIDGVPFSSESIGSVSTSGQYLTLTSPLNAINPSDIESVEILKDADATAIYGSRGANGVVLITTKKGRSGKLEATLNASTSFGTVTRMVDLMGTQQYLNMRRQAYANDGITDLPADAYDINGTWDQNRYTDWQKELIGKTAQITALQGSIQGGSELTNFILGGSYRRETTVMPGDFHYDKMGLHAKLNHKSADNTFSLVASMDYNVQKNDQPAVDLSVVARTLAPNAPSLYNPDGTLNWADGFENPLAALLQNFQAKVNSLAASATLSYEIVPSLMIKANLGLTDLRNNESKTIPYTIYNPAYGLGPESSSLDLNQTTRTSWIAEPQLNYRTTLWGGQIDGLIGATFQQQQTDRLYQFGYGFTSNSLIHDLSAASMWYVSANNQSLYRYNAAFGRINYNFQGRYIINLTGRRDGSSRFGPGRRFANFGAVGAAWILTKEKFLEDNSLVSFAKLRGSYGTTGSDQVGDYQYLDTYSTTGMLYGGVPTLQPTRLYNPNFGWESNKKLEFGAELGLWKDRVSLSVAWYCNRSSNQLVGIPLPGTTGFSSVTANLGATVENSGIEFSVNTVNIQSKDFEWNSSFNISTNRNRLIAFPGLEASTYANSYIIGQPLTMRRLYHYTGVDPQTGVYTFADANGDGNITATDDRSIITDLTPKYFGGLQNNLHYKGLELEILFQFVKQKNFEYLPALPGVAINQPSNLGNVWTQPGDNAQGQLFSAGNNAAALNAFNRYAQSDAALTDASFIRLKNIALYYTLPEFSKTLRCRLYLQAQNLLTFTPFRGGDPELRFNSYLPPLKVIATGIQLNF
jgi:TonB-linked SusC/RagA family outer membrane protein